MTKKAQSISINTVIVATLAILVLVVVIVIFMNGMKPLPNAANLCATYKGTCEETCEEGTTQLTGQKTECVDKNSLCCIPAGTG